jgi:hypothetical protein
MSGEVYDQWDFANRQKLRFFVVNVALVLGRLHLPHTNAKPYFATARRVIVNETEWHSQHGFQYESSHTQIYPEKRRLPKYFGHAVTIVVAMEMAARELNPELNVYDFLRILPADYFVDRLDRTRLDALIKHHDALSPEQRAERFGPEFAQRSFLDTCTAKIDQRVDVASQVADGFCLTKFTAGKLREFINQNYPAELHVGAVRSCGEDADIAGLGTKHAAALLRVPEVYPLDQLPPCR